MAHILLTKWQHGLKAWVYGRLHAGIVGSNPATSMKVCLLSVLCGVKQNSLPRADHSSGGVLPSVVCLIECSREGR
jgi:hypothetical protein